MLTQDQALERLDHALLLARRAGADAADATYFGESSTGIGVRLGKLEEVGRSETGEIGLRVFLGARSAQVSITDLATPALEEAAARALFMAKEAIPDRYAGLADADLLARGPFPDLDLYDPAVESLAPDRLRAMALAAEDEARASERISSSEGASASSGTMLSALATSTGFRGASRATSVSLSAVVIAGEGAARQRDYDWHATRHLDDLEAPATIGHRAAERAISRLNPKKAATGKMPVVFDPRVSASIIGHLFAAITGPAIARKTSFLLAHPLAQLFPATIRIVDDPHRRRGLNSRMFDGEGLPTAPRAIVEGGRLTGWLMDSTSARQLGAAPTGHASHGTGGTPGVAASNLYLEPGKDSPEALLAGIEDGLYVNELIGSAVSILTGDYSRGASGFRIRHGALAEPVTEATISGHLLAMFESLVVASDLVFRQAVNAPTIRIDAMTVAGE